MIHFFSSSRHFSDIITNRQKLTVKNQKLSGENKTTKSKKMT